MATKPPSDEDIFLDEDDDEPPQKGGSKPPAAPASGGGKKMGKTPVPPAGGPSLAPKKPTNVPAKKKKKEEDFDFDAYDYDGIAQALQFRMVKAPKKELEKIAKAMSGMSKPGISLQERMAYKRMMTDAKVNLKKIEDENKDFVKQNNKFQNLRNDAIRKLHTLREHKKENGNSLSREDLIKLEDMEQKLLLSIGNTKLDSKDHESNKQVAKLLEEVQKQVSKLPEELQEKFEELDERTEAIMKAQEEASEYLKESHEKMRSGMKRAAMGTLDFVGLGGIARGVGKVYGAGKSVAHGVKTVNRYMQARRVVGDTHSPEDPDVIDEYAEKHGISSAAPRPVDQKVSVPPAEYDPDDPLTWSKEQRAEARKNGEPKKGTKSGKKLKSPTENAEALANKVAKEANDAIAKAMKTSLVDIKKQMKDKGREIGPATFDTSSTGTPGANTPAEARSDFVGPIKPTSVLSDQVDNGDHEENSKRVVRSEQRKDDRARHVNGRFKKKGDAATVKPQSVSGELANEAADSDKKERRKSGDKEKEESDELNSILSKHAASMERFNTRLLAELRGRSKAASQAGGGGISSMIGPLVEQVGGLIGKVGPLMGMLGQGAAIGGAFMAGHYVGTKIYEHAGGAIGKGVDAASNFATHIMGGTTNDDKIEQMLKGTGAGSPNKPNEAKGKVTPSIDPGKSLPSGVKPSTAGAGRGSVNPTGVAPSASSTEVPPTPTVTPVSTGSAAGAQMPPDGGGKVGGSEKDGSNGGNISEHMGKIFTKSTGVNVDGVNPQMQDALVRMGQEYFDATGKKLNFNSAYRSMEEQEQLYRTKPPGMAGKPGSSLHNFGLAVDIPSTQANELDKLGLLSKYGFNRPISNEKWHIQPVGVSVAAAKQGVYSADSPVDQGGKRQPEQQQATAKQSAPSVTNANYEPPAGAGVGVGTGSGGTTNMTTGGGGTAGGTRVSASSIPTFDNSDGMFLALNTGIV